MLLYICPVSSTKIHLLGFFSALQMYRSDYFASPFLLQHRWSIFFIFHSVLFVFHVYVFLFFDTWNYFWRSERHSLYMYWLLRHLNFSHFIGFLFIDWCCYNGSLMYFLSLLFTFLLFTLLIPLPLPLSVTNLTILGLFFCGGGLFSAVVSGNKSLSKLNSFLVFINLSSCFPYSDFLFVFLLVLCVILVLFYFPFFFTLEERFRVRIGVLLCCFGYFSNTYFSSICVLTLP